jgi:peptidoglycan hydrolase CwlO-like protein
MAGSRGQILVSFLAVSLSLILLSSSIHAQSVPESQEDMKLTMERGSSFQFFLLVNDVEEEVTLIAEGDIEDWVRFGEGKLAEMNITPTFYTSVVLVTVTVPDDMELGEYEGVINADNAKLASLEIKVTLELSDAKAYEQLSDVDKEVSGLKDKVESQTDSLNSMRIQLATLKKEVSDRMEEIYEYQRDLVELEDAKSALETENSELQQDLESLQAKSDDLEESNRQLNEMTGMLVGTQLPGMFLGGVILGVIFVTLVIKRSHVAKKIKTRIQRARGKGREESFRYNFSG